MGRILGEVYEPGAELGRGAFGRVLAGRRREDGAPVAIKLPLEPLPPEMRARLAREVGLLRELRHPRLARLLDALPAGETPDSDPALVYELVPGEPLDRVLEARRPGLAEVRTWAGDLAGALEVLGSRDLVHRDLKTANIMITPEGRAVLLDFGLLRRAEGGTLTATGVVLGTPSTIAPEMLRGESVGPPADVYALACVLWECLTGAPPFEGSSAAVLGAHLKDPPPPLRGTPPGFPAAAGRALVEALAKDPAARPAAAAVAEAFDLVDESLGATRAVPGPGGHEATTAPFPRPAPAAAPAPAPSAPARAAGASRVPLAVAGVVALGLAGWFARPPPPPSPLRLDLRLVPGGAWVDAVGDEPAALVVEGARRILAPGSRAWLPLEPSRAYVLRAADGRLRIDGGPPIESASVLGPRIPAGLAAAWRAGRRGPVLHVLAGAPPPDRVAFEAATGETGRADPDPADPRRFPLPAELLDALRIRESADLHAPPRIDATAHFGPVEGPTTRVPLPALGGELESVELAPRQATEDPAPVAAGPVPFGDGRLLLGDRESCVALVRPGALGEGATACFLERPAPGTPDGSTYRKPHWGPPFLAPAKDGGAWYAPSGVDLWFRITALPPGARDQHVVDVTYLGVRDLADPGEGVVPVPGAGREFRSERGPQETLDGTAWVGPVRGAHGIVVSEGGARPRLHVYDPAWIWDALHFPSFRSRGGWVVGHTRKAKVGGETRYTSIEAATGTILWEIVLPHPSQSPPAPVAGGVVLLHDGKLLRFPEDRLRGRVDAEVATVLHDTGDPTRNPNRTRFTAWILTDGAAGPVDVLRFPDRDPGPTPLHVARMRPEDPIRWTRLSSPAPDATAEERRLHLEPQDHPRTTMERTAFYGARPVPGTSLVALLAHTDANRSHFLLLDRAVPGLAATHALPGDLEMDTRYVTPTFLHGPTLLPRTDPADPLRVFASDHDGGVHLWSVHAEGAR